MVWYGLSHFDLHGGLFIKEGVTIKGRAFVTFSCIASLPFTTPP